MAKFKPDYEFSLGVSFRVIENGYVLRDYDVFDGKYKEIFAKNPAELGQQFLEWAATVERGMRKNLEEMKDAPKEG